MDQGRFLEAERLTRAMATTRAKITGTVGELRESANRAIDWREQVKTHPAAALAAVATGAMLVGHWLGARMSARAPRSGASPQGSGDERTPQRGTLVSGPWMRAGSRVSDLLNRVIDEVGDTVERAAIPPLIARVQGFLQPSSKAYDTPPRSRGDAGGRVEAPGVYPGVPAGRQSEPSAESAC
jgi:hypothetical protein